MNVKARQTLRSGRSFRMRSSVTLTRSRAKRCSPAAPATETARPPQPLRARGTASRDTSQCWQWRGVCGAECGSGSWKKLRGTRLEAPSRSNRRRRALRPEAPAGGPGSYAWPHAREIYSSTPPGRTRTRPARPRPRRRPAEGGSAAPPVPLRSVDDRRAPRGACATALFRRGRGAR